MFKLLFSFQGRIGRAQYWAGCTLAGGAVLLSVVPLAGEYVGGGGKTASLGGSLAGSLASLCLSLLSTWWALAVQVKRFHDRGRSGYWCLLPFLPMVMIFSTLIGAFASGTPIEAAIGSTTPWVVMCWVLALWFFVELGCLTGTPGPNKYDRPSGTPGANPPTPPKPSLAASLLGFVETNATPPTANTLANAEQAMARAIAERDRAMSPPATMPALATAAPAGFGRKSAR